MDLYSSYSDKELFASIAEGDEEAFACLYYRYTGVLYPYVLSILKLQSEAEEVVQETMIRVWMNRDKLEGVSNPKAWTFRIASNVCYNLFRRKLVEEKAASHISARYTGSSNSENVLDFREIHHVLKEAIENLSPQRKQVFKLSREEGLKIQEIAEKLGIAETTVKKTLQVALEKLREELVKKGYAISLFWMVIKNF